MEWKGKIAFQSDWNGAQWESDNWQQKHKSQRNKAKPICRSAGQAIKTNTNSRINAAWHEGEEAREGEEEKECELSQWGAKLKKTVLPDKKNKAQADASRTRITDLQNVDGNSVSQSKKCAWIHLVCRLACTPCNTECAHQFCVLDANTPDVKHPSLSNCCALLSAGQKLGILNFTSCPHAHIYDVV